MITRVIAELGPWTWMAIGLLLLTAATGQGVSRREGIALLALYIAYWAWLGFGAS